MPFVIRLQRYNKNFNYANKWHIFFSQGIKKNAAPKDCVGIFVGFGYWL